MSDSNDPMAAVGQYVDGFNNGDEKAMAAACADPMQILDGMSPHVWQGPTATEDWWLGRRRAWVVRPVPVASQPPSGSCSRYFVPKTRSNKALSP